MISFDLIRCIVKYPLVVPHLIAFHLSSNEAKRKVLRDLAVMRQRTRQKRGIAYFLVIRKPYRNLFYHRIPGARFFRFLLPKYKLFTIVNGSDIEGGAFVLNHPYGTIINAKKIGSYFTICHLTTIGNGRHARNDLLPVIGDNVSIGANVNIIGDIHIGDNVIIGAGSVVVKDVPSNCIVAGNPARIIKQLSSAANY